MERVKKRAEICTVGVLIAIVWLLFSIPTIIQFSPIENSSSGKTSSDSEVCVPEVYEGVCKRHLLVYRDCSYNTTAAISSLDGGVVYIPSGQGNQEDSAHEALAAVTVLLSPSTDYGGEAVRPSSGQCDRLRTEVCASEWERAETIASALPPEAADQLGFLQCATLENHSVCDLPSVKTSQANTSSVNATTNTTIQCSSDFYLNEFGICRPVCGEWQQYSESTAVAVETIVLLCASTIIMLSVVVIVLSCIQYKRMLKLPGVLIVYQLISSSILQVAWVISYTDTKSLYCSHSDLGETFSDPTPFCHIIGALAYYIPLQTTLFWLCHVIMLLCAINFPFQVRRLLDNPKHSGYLHVAILLACSFLPVITVGSSFALGDYITQFPPVYCTTEDPDASYYLVILPLSIVCAVGVSCLVLILWSLVRHRRSRQTNVNGPPAVQQTHMKAEVKILTLFICFTVIMVVGISNVTVVLRSYDEFARELTDYFKCESLGGDCSRSGIENADSSSYAITASQVALTVYPLVTLIYVVNLNEIKEGLKIRKHRTPGQRQQSAC